MNEVILKIGKVAIKLRGEWQENPDNPYMKLDAVSNDGSSYVSRVDNNVYPTSDSSKWMVLAKKGENGGKVTLEDFTPDELAELQRPATEAAQSLSALGKKIECLVEKAEPALENVIQYSDRLIALELEVFPYEFTVTGGGIYKKEVPVDVTIKWEIRRKNQIVTPEQIYINGNLIEDSIEGETFTNVTLDTEYEIKAIIEGKEIINSINVKFVNPSYYGIVKDDFILSEGNISSLLEIIKDSKKYESSATTSYEKICYAYPAYFGELESIIDESSQEILRSFTKSSIKMNGENYFVYILTNSSTVKNYKIKFI